MVRRGLLRSGAERQGRSRRSRSAEAGCGLVGQGGRGVSGSGVVGRVQVRRGGLGVERSGKSWLGRAVTGYKGESDEVYEKNASRAY
jgi:hypothetical protein